MASTSHNRTSLPPTRWDVFLSFRGDDTRYSFTAHLYRALCRAGIKTFMDSPELPSGEVISDSLIQAIQDSNTHIVVLSENYASSSWCLGELEEILACYKRMKRLVIPVFYHIHPAVVRHQSGSFKEAFEKHPTRFDSEKVNKWRLTLKEVADFSGFRVYKTKSEVDVINDVIDRISLKINPKTLYVAKYPVGLDSRIKDVTALLNSDTEGVIRIGIHGMGGVGKTTLAKAVYNKNYQRFQGSCFLANVRDVSARENGIESLQHKLIVDVLECNSFNIDNKDQGIELIRARIRSTKVLLVIDDLDNSTALEYLEGSFALGSVIVITTRNEDLLDLIKVQTKYSTKELDDEESRQLFAQHAFEDNKIPCTFAEMSEEILQRAGGLPLALQVFGSNLLGKREEEWKQFINKLSRVPFDDIEKKLMISFDALKSEDPMLQEIFLDIACFHIGKGKEKVVKVLETYYTFVNLHIDFLIRRCLLTINDYNGLWMHDLLRDMGRRIAQNNCPDEPGKHSRLWVAEDIKSVLKNNKGTDAIQGINSPYYYLFDQEVDAESFKRMSNLRLLSLYTTNITGSFEKAFENLRCLYWKSCPLKYLPPQFYPQKLVTLELPQSKMKAIWERNMVPGVLEKLKTLNMKESSNLTTTPDFTRLPCLESLDLSWCRSLEEVDKSIGLSVSLVSLNLAHCRSLKRVPDFTSLPHLEILDLSWCESLKEVHVSIGSLVSLVSLNLEKCENLRSLPDSICRLRALKVLNILSCKSLKALPTELGNIESLKVFNASQLRVSKLPYSIGRLGNLVELHLRWNKSLETLPDSICKLRSLQILDIGSCKKLEELPDQLGMITSLRDLRVIFLTMLKKIPDISQLSNIEDLDLIGCHRLLSISDFPPNLKSIRADGTYLKRLPNLSHLKQLEELNLSGSGFTDIKGLEELTCLRQLFLEGCSNLLSISELPPNLKSIKAGGCKSLKRFANLSHLKQLEELVIWGIDDFTEIEIKGLEELTCLRRLSLNNCYHLLSISELPPNLKSISARGCTSLERLPNLSNLKQLEELNLENCSGLTEIKGLEELTSLENLNLEGCNSSLLASTLTIRFFQILSGFGHTVQIQIGSFEFQESSKVFGTRMSFDLQPSASDNLMGIIICFSLGDVFDDLKVTYSSGGFVWSDVIIVRDYADGSVIVIVPSSLLVDQLIEDGHNTLEVTRYNSDNEYWYDSDNEDEEISCGIHLVYETEIKMISGYKVEGTMRKVKENLTLGSSSTNVNVEEGRSLPFKRLKRWECERIKPSEHNLERTTVNVEDERSKPSDNDLESNKKWLTLGSSSTNVNVEESNNSDNEKGERIKPSEHTVNVEDERSKPSDNDLESNKKWLTLGSSSTNVNVEEGRSPPSKRWECDSNWLSL